MVIGKLGSLLNLNAVSTFPLDYVERLIDLGKFNVKTGEGINNILLWQMMVYHGNRGLKSLHDLNYPASFEKKFDPILNCDYMVMSSYQTNKTWKPSVKDPVNKREPPPAFAIPGDRIRCGVSLLYELGSVRPSKIKTRPNDAVPTNLFLRPIPVDHLPEGRRDAPFGSIELFYPVPMGNESIGKMVKGWAMDLGVDTMGISNSSMRHMLAQLMREHGVDDKTRMAAGGWRSQKGMDNYGSSTRANLHHSFMVKTGRLGVAKPAIAAAPVQRPAMPSTSPKPSVRQVIECEGYASLPTISDPLADEFPTPSRKDEDIMIIIIAQFVAE